MGNEGKHDGQEGGGKGWYGSGGGGRENQRTQSRGSRLLAKPRRAGRAEPRAHTHTKKKKKKKKKHPNGATHRPLLVGVEERDEAGKEAAALGILGQQHKGAVLGEVPLGAPLHRVLLQRLFQRADRQHRKEVVDQRLQVGAAHPGRLHRQPPPAVLRLVELEVGVFQLPDGEARWETVERCFLIVMIDFVSKKSNGCGCAHQLPAFDMVSKSKHAAKPSPSRIPGGRTRIRTPFRIGEASVSAERPLST